MNKISDMIHEIGNLIENGQMIGMAFSGNKKGGNPAIKNVKVKLVDIGDKRMVQFESRTTDNKALHENLGIKDALDKIDTLLKNQFFQLQIFANQYDYHVFSSKKDSSDTSIRVLKKAPTKKPVSTSHNRKKHYILDEGEKHDFLIKLGISDANGSIIAKKYDKFRQLNRYLEFVRDIIPEIHNGGKLRIVDFGCGKAYLTFALYYYLVEMLKIDAEIVGLDLKEDVIRDLKKINSSIGFEKLIFKVGDISNYEIQDDNEGPDLVISLHACDTATDASILKAVEWNAKAIMAVPCCQHEINKMIGGKSSIRGILKYGIFKERFSSILTDSLRGMALESIGYNVQMVEFVDMEHTPKNILIRGVRSKGHGNEVVNTESFEEYNRLKKEFGIEKIYIDSIFNKKK